MRSFRYLWALLFLPLTAAAIGLGGWWSFNVPVVAFVLVPLLELQFGEARENLGPEDERNALADRIYDAIVFSVVPLHLAVFTFYLWRVSTGALDPVGRVGATWSMGIACGAYGINVAHELGHRKTGVEQFLAKILLLTSLYMHFFIEHNRGHHRRVATPEDPASARWGESVYRFWLRSIGFGYVSAWEIENSRLRRQGRRLLSLRNEMVRLHLYQAAALLGVTLAFGWRAGLAYVTVAAIGILLLETINYIEHYGLTRKRKDNGKYEFVLAAHSWNSDHVLGRTLLFELTRHSDHHANVARPYQVLRHTDDSPQLPTGYPGMMVLALMPPIWFRVMNRRLSDFRQSAEV